MLGCWHATKREDFVPAHRALAFADIELLLQADAQAVAQGVAWHLIVRSADVAGPGPAPYRQRAGDRYRQRLHGFFAGLQAGKVLSLEIVPELAQQARENLRKANVTWWKSVKPTGARFQQAGDPLLRRHR